MELLEKKRETMNNPEVILQDSLNIKKLKEKEMDTREDIRVTLKTLKRIYNLDIKVAVNNIKEGEDEIKNIIELLGKTEANKYLIQENNRLKTENNKFSNKNKELLEENIILKENNKSHTETINRMSKSIENLSNKKSFLGGFL
jgi:predicted nuclease with TOPRIM domain